jgi:hypothetical protein
MFVLIITFINVIIKTLGINDVSVHVNKIDYALILCSFALVFINLKSQTKKTIKVVSSIFAIYTFVSLVSSLKNFDDKVLGQAILNSKYYVVLLFCYYGNFDFKIIPKIEKFIFIVVISNFVFLLLGKYVPDAYASLFSGATIDSIIQGTNIKRYSGLFYHPGPMGVFVSLCLLWSIAMWWTNNCRPILLYVAFLSIISLILSGQRMEFVACIFVLLVGYLIKVSKSTFLVLLVGVLLFIGFIVIVNSHYIFDTLLNINQQNLEDINARYVLYLGGFDLALQHFPFGNGLATFGSSMSINNSEAAYFELGISRLWWFEGDSYLTDTFWAMVIGESGLLGALLYFLLIFYLLIISFKLLRSNHKGFLFIPLFSFLSMVFTLLISIATPFYTGAALPLLIVGIINALNLRTYEEFTRAYK